MADAGKKPPESAEDKVNLAVAILSEETGHDLVPIFRMWRFPVTVEKVNWLKAQYEL